MRAPASNVLLVHGSARQRLKCALALDVEDDLRLLGRLDDPGLLPAVPGDNAPAVVLLATSHDGPGALRAECVAVRRAFPDSRLVVWADGVEASLVGAIGADAVLAADASGSEVVDCVRAVHVRRRLLQRRRALPVRAAAGVRPRTPARM